jgi:hypothetical protein
MLKARVARGQGLKKIPQRFGVEGPSEFGARASVAEDRNAGAVALAKLGIVGDVFAVDVQGTVPGMLYVSEQVFRFLAQVAALGAVQHEPIQ